MFYAINFNSAWLVPHFLLSLTISLVWRGKKKKELRRTSQGKESFLKGRILRWTFTPWHWGKKLPATNHPWKGDWAKRGDVVTKYVAANLPSLFMAFHKVPSSKMAETPHLYSIKIKWLMGYIQWTPTHLQTMRTSHFNSFSSRRQQNIITYPMITWN